MTSNPPNADASNDEASDTPNSENPIDESHGYDVITPSDALIEYASHRPDELLGKAFDAYYNTFWHLVTFRMDRRLMARLDADDVLQDAFLASKKRLHHWTADPKFSLFAWLRMTLVQSLVDAHRRHLGADMRCAGRETMLNGPKMPNTTAASLAMGLAGGATSPSNVAIRRESHEQLQQAIETMTATDQEMIALRHFEGLTNKQAAEVLGLNITTASNRYVRALDRLQQLLGGDPEADGDSETNE